MYVRTVSNISDSSSVKKWGRPKEIAHTHAHSRYTPSQGIKHTHTHTAATHPHKVHNYTHTHTHTENTHPHKVTHTADTQSHVPWSAQYLRMSSIIFSSPHDHHIWQLVYTPWHSHGQHVDSVLPVLPTNTYKVAIIWAMYVCVQTCCVELIQEYR